MNHRCFSICLSALLTCLIPFSIEASDGKNIARCFDENGDVTYSDVLCATYENDNPLLMKDNAVQRHIKSKEAITNDSGSIANVQLSTVTNEAIERCQQRFARYFNRKYHTTSEVPAIKFDQLVDQYSKGANVSISALGTFQYQDATTSRMLNIECTAQKLGPDAN
jgi:hypothetical protein